jgi:hypothetical protein
MESNERLKNSIKSKIAISQFKVDSIAMKKSKNPIVKTIITACACLLLTSGIVFAKDIEKVVKKLFSNTSPAVEEAVENGYVQSIENDFTYDQGIGIEVDNIVLDELSLNISIKFSSEIDNVKYMRFNDFVILTDTGEKIFDNDQQYETDLANVYTAQSMKWQNMPEKVEDNLYSDSILFTLGDRSKEKNELIFKIQSVDVTYQDNITEEIEGNWEFTIEITDEMRQSQSIEYILEEPNEYIESCVGTLYPTGLEVEFNLKSPLNPMDYSLKNSGNISGPGFFFIKDVSGYKFPNDIESVDIDYKKYVMKYDSISIFSEIQEKIEIYLEPFESSIFLIKK